MSSTYTIWTNFQQDGPNHLGLLSGLCAQDDHELRLEWITGASTRSKNVISISLDHLVHPAPHPAPPYIAQHKPDNSPR